MQSLDDIQLSSLLPSLPAQSSENPVQSSANSSEVLINPQVKDEFIPKIEQQFANLEEVYTFYNNYAYHGGFSVRVHSSKSNTDGQTTRKEFVCFKQGKKQPTTTRPIKHKRGIIREDCPAKVTVVRRGEGYEVSQFVEGHNHPLTTPMKVHLLHSHRKVTPVQKCLMQQLGDANVPPFQQMSILELQNGGLQNVGFTKKDLYNDRRDKKKLVDGHDGNMIYEYLQSEKEKNSGFAFTFETDDEQRMTHCFWADTTCRKSYKYFGDVVVFDSTYDTNKYSLIFAPIVGVNHHGQTTLFGCAFLSDETCESFEWFFKEWLKAMPGGPPQMIITDQDPAMAKAIASTLPNTYHRLCIWHIVNKFSQKLGALAYVQHYEEFKKCIWNSENPDEFEARWLEIVQKAQLSSNEWLNDMYTIRARWIPAYTKHIFSAHMTSSQRSESDHAFFKRYVSKKNSLLEFVTRFDRALSNLRHNELDLDHKDVNEKPVLKTSWLLEKRMSELYTRTIFYKFQREIHQKDAYVFTKTDEDEHRCLWNVQRAEIEGSRFREILVNKSSNYVSCSCKMFEFEGIPCRHMLAYFARMQIMALSDQYILQRWTVAAKASRVLDDLGGERGKELCGNSILMRRQRVFQLFSNVVDDALLTEEGTQVLEEALESVTKKVALMKISREDGEGSGIRVPVSLGSQLTYKEPLLVRAKGCGKRLKGGKEKAVKALRKCNGCGLTGQSHDKRNCPKLLNMSSQYTRLNDEDDDEDDTDNE
ncbi:protein FAR1-RELATED SEQUENCE 5-like [Rhododendron vialii]|uniref:protein FAR1-RELATED SEQUENCE 5-like n=1 Tax=Rhododendron vialii TaxID=182163 RepID=UPI0026602DCF|nr:protein FAR1-RELATED SEQUENCE 5-like [Rhododendron vialii]